VRIFGHEPGILQSKAEEVRQILSHVQGVTDLHIEQQVEQPGITIEVNLAKAQQYGLKPGDVRRAAATLVAGLEAGSLFQEQKIFPVVVWSVPNVRHSVNSIRDLLIDTPSGQWVHLGDVASVKIVPIPNLIQHEADHVVLM
jgi:Cu/Ag efflux pump CusA